MMTIVLRHNKNVIEETFFINLQKQQILHYDTYRKNYK